MYEWLKNILENFEPIQDSIYGPRYRCSLTLKDGTIISCAVIQSKGRLVDLAKKRIKEEMQGRGHIGGKDPYGQIVSSFVAQGNRINDYDVASSTQSRFAIPLTLLSQIHGETTMGWTGWVFRMRDGKQFSYGTSFNYEFFQLPEGYEFHDIEEVINHSFVDLNGIVEKLKRGSILPAGYHPETVLRERIFFTCAVDDI